MFAAPVEVELKPSNKKGIRFFVNDSVIEAKIENVVSTEHCVILADVEQGGNNKIALVEHFMAACAICEIDALDVYITSEGFEMPIFDGSAKMWVEKFKETGFEGETDVHDTFNTVLMFQNNNTALFIVPIGEAETKITYAVNYNHPDLKNRWVTLVQDENLDDVIEARTFGYLSDLEKFQQAGYSKGVTAENTVGLKDDGTYTTELRSEFEPIKHKILDIIGDLYLTGFNPLKLKANIIVKEAGHSVHCKVAKNLKELMTR